MQRINDTINIEKKARKNRIHCFHQSKYRAKHPEKIKLINRNNYAKTKAKMSALQEKVSQLEAEIATAIAYGEKTGHEETFESVEATYATANHDLLSEMSPVAVIPDFPIDDEEAASKSRHDSNIKETIDEINFQIRKLTQKRNSEQLIVNQREDRRLITAKRYVALMKKSIEIGKISNKRQIMESQYENERKKTSISPASSASPAATAATASSTAASSSWF
jgi:hypothetical protein